MSDIEKVIAKSNHLEAPSLKGAARLVPWQGRETWKTKDGGARGGSGAGCVGKGREEPGISRVSTQRDRRREKRSLIREVF